MNEEIRLRLMHYLRDNTGQHPSKIDIGISESTIWATLEHLRTDGMVGYGKSGAWLTDKGIAYLELKEANNLDKIKRKADINNKLILSFIKKISVAEWSMIIALMGLIIALYMVIKSN